MAVDVSRIDRLLFDDEVFRADRTADPEDRDRSLFVVDDEADEVCGGDACRGAPNSLLLAASLASLIGALAMSAWYVAWPMWRAQSFEPNPAHFNTSTLPRGVPLEISPMERAKLVSGNGRVSIDRWAPGLRNLRVEMEKLDILMFRIY